MSPSLRLSWLVHSALWVHEPRFCAILCSVTFPRSSSCSKRLRQLDMLQLRHYWSGNGMVTSKEMAGTGYRGTRLVLKPKSRAREHARGLTAYRYSCTSTVSKADIERLLRASAARRSHVATTINSAGELCRAVNKYNILNNCYFLPQV